MAKSKNGGTRAMIRGRIANDVYSIGKDGKGKKQQVVRSLADEVKNPRTLAQMQGRCIMATCMQVVSAISPIIDHSFDGVPAGQPSISEFIRRNYALLKADSVKLGGFGQDFIFNKYQVKGALGGKYEISDGELDAFPTANYNYSMWEGSIFISGLSEAQIVAADLYAAIKLDTNDFVTLVILDSNGAGQWLRLKKALAVDSTTVLTADNLSTAFTMEGTFNPAMGFSGSTDKTLYIGLNTSYSAEGNGCAVILTKEAESGYVHSPATMKAPQPREYGFTAAVETYPLGDQKFLNGGDA